MDKEILKSWILAKKGKVYNIIASTYKNEIDQIGITLFCDWMTKDFGLKEGDLKVGSLGAAVRRLKKLSKPNEGEKKTTDPEPIPTQNHNLIPMPDPNYVEKKKPGKIMGDLF